MRRVTHSSPEMSDLNINKIAEIIRNGDKKFIFLVGAGISTSAGIPDFRSPKTGLYHNLQKLKLPYAEAVFDIDYFSNNPKPFYILSKELYPGQFLPTSFHLLVKLMEQRKLLKRIYTQNIDTLERLSGIHDDYIVEAHGSFNANHCIDCGSSFENESFKELIFKDIHPTCEKCDGLVKPDITFFGEALPAKFFDKWDADFTEIDEKGDFVLVTAGTSLSVYPFASLPGEVSKRTQRVLVNKEIVGDYKTSPRKTDIIILDDIDTFADELIRELNWSKDFEKLSLKIKNKLEKDTMVKEFCEIKREISIEIVTGEEENSATLHEELTNLTKSIGNLEIDNSDLSDFKNPEKDVN
ncbi:hypothetical protein WICMUC_000111 [Wickerhamomyces mucosus]|uniref:NAD-dependent protein deacetylase n=1 Tax=Wickerhamomyces mucosus TaxID=1378264 RepID=A0A9P8Q084_9ASCO|nr:hypothetical protein WICMUC_000111 [Wickerhamomyces mucosus]